MLNKFIKPQIKKIKAYSVEDFPCRIKLDANESPYSFRINQNALKQLQTNRYPDPEAKELRRLLAKQWKVRAENILHGNGSDELIYYIITTFRGPVLFPYPTFSMYDIISRAAGEKVISVPLNRDFDLDLDSILKSIKTQKPGIIFLSSPNNPTGNSFSRDKILKTIKSSKGIVIVDEAYQPFSKSKSLIPEISGHKNLIILRSLSKIGLAALRLGFMIANNEIIKEVSKVRLPFNISSTSQALAIDIMTNTKILKKRLEIIKSEKDRLYRELLKIDGITPYPSEANFILIRVKNAKKVFKSLIKDGILIRDISNTLNNCIRVTVGKPGENRMFLKSLRSCVIAL